MFSLHIISSRFSHLVLLLAITLSLLHPPSAVHAATFVVDSLADDTVDDTFCTLREAILAANNTPINTNCGAGSSGDDTITFSVSGIITLSSTLPEIVDGQGKLIIDGNGNITISGNNSVRVIIVEPNANLTLQNLTVADGQTLSNGGGVANQGTLTATNVTFSGNSANVNGGGLYNVPNNNATLTDVTFNNNSASWGGGIHNSQSNVTLTDVTFSGNSATLGGGGIYNSTSSPTLTNVIFSLNTANNRGGGMYNHGNSNPSLIDVVFSANSANIAGGGMYNDDSSPTLTNAIFSNNSATAGSGGGLYNDNSSPSLTNVTLNSNQALSGSGGALYNDNSSNPTIRNSILWGNSASVSNPQVFNNSSNPTFSSSDAQDCGGSGTSWVSTCGIDGGGNIDADPLFINAPINLRLQVGSPAMNAGNNTFVPIDVTTDLDGNSRIFGSAVDMGAYEFISRVFLPLILRSAP